MREQPRKYAATIAHPFESCVLKPYHDPVGYPTIGWGHLLSYEKWADLSKWDHLNPITQEYADDLFDHDLLKAQSQMLRLIDFELTARQEGAILDFVFNVGSGNFQGSTLRRVINRKDFDGVPTQLMRWVKAGGITLRGLVRRRQAEVNMWNID